MNQIAMYLGYIVLSFICICPLLYIIAAYQLSKYYEDGWYWKLKAILKKAREK